MNYWSRFSSGTVPNDREKAYGSVIDLQICLDYVIDKLKGFRDTSNLVTAKKLPYNMEVLTDEQPFLPQNLTGDSKNFNNWQELNLIRDLYRSVSYKMR